MRTMLSSMVFSFVVFVMGCGGGSQENILEPEVFRPVLKEILLAESGVDALALSYSEKKLAREQRYQLIFKNHNLTPEAFMRNFEYYRSNPEIMDSIYGGILDELNEDLMQHRVLPSLPTQDDLLNAR